MVCVMSLQCVSADSPVGRDNISYAWRKGGREGWREGGMGGRDEREKERKSRGVCLPCLGACYSEEPQCLPSVGWLHLVLF